jgi:hypothetical protein
MMNLEVITKEDLSEFKNEMLSAIELTVAARARAIQAMA